MINFNKALTSKIISLIIAVSFLMTDISYAGASSQGSLRVPVGKGRTYNRMKEAGEAQPPAAVAAVLQAAQIQAGKGLEGGLLEGHLKDLYEISDIVDLGNAASYSSEETARAMRDGKLIKLDFRKIGFAKDLPEGLSSKYYQVLLNISDFSEFCQDKLSGDFGDTSPYNFGYAIKELLKNAFVHGNKLDFDLPVYLHFDFVKHEIKVYDFAKIVTGQPEWEQRKYQAKVAEIWGSGLDGQFWMVIINNTSGWTYRRESVTGNLGTMAIVSYNSTASAAVPASEIIVPTSDTRNSI